MAATFCGKTYYKVGLHIHTTRSDGQKTPEEVCKLYRQHGYDAIALTDHWLYGESKEQNGLLVLSGCEYNTFGADTIAGVTHLVGIGMKEDPQIPKTADRQQIIDAVRKAGGIVVLAHPAWSLNTLEDSQKLHGILATEIYNAVSESGESIRPYSDFYVDLCANAGIYYKIFATDDTHYYDGTDECKGWVMVQAENNAADDLLSALKNGKFFATQGPQLSVTRKGNRFLIDTSPCRFISVASNLSWVKNRTLRGENLTHFEYTMQPDERWVRVQIADQNGKLAWSNLFLPEVS